MNSKSKIEIDESKSNLAVPEVYLENGTGNIKTRFRSDCQDKPENVIVKKNTICNSIVTKVDTKHSTKLKGKCKWFFKKLVLFSVSHIGLTCIVVGYSILGAILFQHLEAPNEEKSRRVISQVRDKRRQEIWNATKKFNVIHEGNWSKTAAEILVKFQKEIFQITKEQGWDGMNDVAEGELYWSFAGALLYSVTVITTIGYGHITPKTKEGRIATMLYALFGIPLTLLCLANIGRTMGKGFRVLYNKIAVIVLDRRMSIFSREKSKTRTHFTYGATANTSYASTSSTGSEKPEVHLSNVSIVHHKKRIKREVPISLCLVIVIGYNLLGSLLFGLWEKQWGFLNGIYFSFITLSTIGFGDIVPGHSLESWQSYEKQVICTLYLLFGLALIAMCFDLMQTQVRVMSKKLAVKIGLLEDDECTEAESTSLEVNPEEDVQSI